MDNYDKDYIDASKNILVVEDNDGLQRLIVKTLNKNGFNAIGVSTGKDAIEQILTSTNLVLLLDQNLPDMTGYDIILHLNSLSIKVPFIVMTGHGDERLAVEMMKLGAYDYLVKDINFTDILPSVLERVFKNILIEKRLLLAEKSLKDSEAKLRSLFEAMQDVIIVLDSKGNYVETAPTSSEILYEKPISLKGKSLFDVFPEKLANEGLQLITNVLKLKSTDYIDYEINLAGKHYWYTATISPYTENTVLWVARDITERKESELAIIEKEKRFRLLVQNSNDIIIIINKEGYPFYISDQISRILGYEQDELVGKDCFFNVHQDDLPNINQVFTGNIARPNEIFKVQYRYQHKNGSWVYLETVGCNLLHEPAVNGIVLNIRDITERKKSEEAIRESEEKWRSYIKAAPYSISIVDENLKFIEVNPATCIITGRSEEELKSIGVPDLLAPESVVPVMNSFKNQILNTGKFYGEGYFTNKFGEKRFWSVASQMISENRFLSFCEDITDRKISEQALIDSEERFRSIFENATIGIYRTTPDGNVIMANPMLINLLGYKSFEDLSKIDVENNGYATPNRREEFLSLMKEKREIKGFESTWLKQNGEKVYIRESAKTFFNDDGSVKYYEGTVEDITEQQLAKEALQESEELFSKLIQAVPDLIIRTDIEGNITFVNDTMLLQGLNIEGESIIGKNIMSFIAEKDLPLAMENTKLMFERPLGVKEYQLVLDDGRLMDSEVNGQIITDTNNQPVGMVYVIRDITERKLTEQSLIESKKIIYEEQKFNRLLIDTSPAFIVAVGFDGKTLMMNKSLLDALEYSNTEISNLDYLSTFVLEEDKLIVADFFSQIISENTEAIKEHRIISKSGKVFLVQWHFKVAARFEASNFFVGIGIDITLQKQAEEQYRSLFENTGTGMIVIEEDFMISLSNETFARNIGYFKEEVEGSMKWSDFVFDDDRDMMIEQHRLRRTNPELAKTSYEFRILNKSGELHYYIINVSMIPGTNKSIASLIDITERKKAELKLQEQEAKMRSITLSAHDAIVMINSEGRITFWNPSAEKMFGYSSEEAIGGDMHQLITPEIYHNKFKQALPEFQKTGKGNVVGKTLELNAKRKDNVEITVELSLSAIELQGKWNAVGIMRDITERKRHEQEIKELNESLEIKVKERTAELNDALKVIEESNFELKELNDSIVDEARKLIQLNEKLAISESELKIANQTKDKFFSIIAHDLRNPIGSMRNVLEILLQYFQQMTNEEIIKMISMLYESSNRTFELLENLLQWSRIQTNRIEFSPDNSILFYNIEKCVNIVAPIAKDKDITINTNISKDIIANYDNYFVDTILRNLLTNAIKFTHKGGTIEIGAKKLVNNDLAQSEKFIEIYIKDNGVGMSKDIMDKLFKIDQNVTMPGTAKEKGTGIGLILSKEFVEKHGGRIWVESEIGQGSIFHFTLPIRTK